ncbi:MAG: GntR family transcriptional regulator [Rhodobacteraceae bacterium]|nr:GntR family transcriptional regulator [Paracoccaceae bacterium]
MPKAFTHTARDRHAVMHHEIRHRICLLDYPPGLRLSEAELAEEFGTSRSPLRRVLARLEDEGLVQSVHGVGTFVTDADIEALAQAYRLRVELVALTGRLDPVPPDLAFMEALDSLIAQSADIIASGTPRRFTQLDMDVFCLLSGLTSNTPLRQIQERLYYGTKRIWLKTAIAARLDLDAEYRIFHQELLDIRRALKVGDLESVAHIQRAHISMSFKRLVQPQRAIDGDAKL